jgi:hypothetical protein
MKYYTFKLDWTNPNEGTNPSNFVNVDGIRFEPSFCVGDEPNALHYAYLISGEINTNDLTQWEVTEVTVEDMLLAAQTVVSDAYLVDGKVNFPSGNIFNNN